MSHISFTVGGVDYSPYLVIDSIDVDDGISEDSDSFGFTLIDQTGVMNVPEAGAEVVLYVNGVKEFGGVLMTADFEHVSSQTIEVSCTARSYLVWVNAKLVAIDTDNWINAGYTKAGDWVKRVIEEFVNPGLAPGQQFTTNNVKDGYPLPRQAFDYVKVGQVLDTIASAIEYSWYVDFDRDVHFTALEDIPSVEPVIDYDTDYRFSELRLTEDISQIINRVYVKDVKSKSDGKHEINEDGDAQKSFWPLAYEPTEVSDAEVYVNGIAQPVQLDPQVADPPPGVYLCIDNWGVRVVPPPGSAEGEAIWGPGIGPNGTTPVKIKYGYLSPIAIVVEDLASQQEMASRAPGTDGIFEYTISMGSQNRVLEMRVAEANAHLVLYKKAWPIISGTMQTFVQGFKAGTCFKLNTNLFKVANSPLSTLMYVLGTKKRIVQHDDDTLVVQTSLTISNNYFR